ncbi:hypothetical protein ACFFH2_15665 [Enterococcus devriesei]|uniref:hypothetical protein n=1 Tax=Enterococcus devriesei TaxID=319970 RepID=UPI0008FFEFDF|nr:hypothetical protein [Enterococcus devriesei]
MKADIQLLPCEIEVVTKREHGFVKETEWVKAGLYDFFQFSKPIPPSLIKGGHSGGVIAYPIAVVRLESGEFKTVNANEVRMKPQEDGE